jgi:GTP:adenosylcobinamide-phosphate guanylyltransferase
LRRSAKENVITTGGRVDGAFKQTIGTSVKALAPFAGSTLLHRTITALREAGVERIAVVGGVEVQQVCADVVERVVPESSDGAENLRRALRAWNSDTPLLYATSDMPFIDGAAVRDFLARAQGNALAMALTEWNDFERRFPGAPPFGITLAGEKVVNGGLFVIPPGGASKVESFGARFFEARKSPLRMARLTGPLLLFQFLFKRLSVARLQAHAQRLLGIPALAIRGAPPEIAYDVDVLEEYRYAIERA